MNAERLAHSVCWSISQSIQTVEIVEIVEIAKRVKVVNSAHSQQLVN
jgi:hypothetical protein